MNYDRCPASTEVIFISTLTPDTVPTQALTQWEPEAVSLVLKLSQREHSTQFYLILNATMLKFHLQLYLWFYIGVKLGH
jgi:hypothetical protein